MLLSIAGSAIFLLLAGSWSQKMIGVELINALQLIYYLHFTSEGYSSAMRLLLEMSVVGVSDLFMLGETQNILALGDHSGF